MIYLVPARKFAGLLYVAVNSPSSDPPTAASAGPDGVRATERLLQVDCEWCGTAVPYAGRGRPPRYCSRGCRQRAYELRTAQTRYDRDAAAGAVRTEPVRRVVERTEQPRVPGDVPGWTRQLRVLTEQLRTGTIAAQPWNYRELRHALADAMTALQDAAGRTEDPGAGDALSPAAALLLDYLQQVGAEVGTPWSTSLRRLADSTGFPAGEVRRALAELCAAALITITRQPAVDADPVDVDLVTWTWLTWTWLTSPTTRGSSSPAPDRFRPSKVEKKSVFWSPRSTAGRARLPGDPSPPQRRWSARHGAGRPSRVTVKPASPSGASYRKRLPYRPRRPHGWGGC